MQGILDHLLKQKKIPAYVESCGLHTTFLGYPPDKRMQEVAKSHGITLENKAKIFEESFFDQFDAIFCVAQGILETVQTMAHTKENLDKIYLATHFSKSHKGEDIPDPYFGGKHGFEMIWGMMEESCKGIVDYFFK